MIYQSLSRFVLIISISYLVERFRLTLQVYAQMEVSEIAIQGLRGQLKIVSEESAKHLYEFDLLKERTRVALLREKEEKKALEEEAEALRVVASRWVVLFFCG
jgi:hypothetical protein